MKQYNSNKNSHLVSVFNTLVLILLTTFFSCCHAKAWQDLPGSISFNPLLIPDDVPAHLVTALAQDSRGFLWIGTQDGLVRFDGYRYKVFRAATNKQPGLSGSYVRSLLVSRDGRIWIGTFSGGLSVFNPDDGTFLHYRHVAEDPNSLLHDRVEGIVEDSKGELWLATDGGLDRFNPNSGQFTHYLHQPGEASSLAANQVRGLLIDSQNQLWVGSHKGLQRWLGEKKGFESIASDPADADSLFNNYVTNIFEDSQGRLWIGTVEHGAAVLDLTTNQLIHLSPKSMAPQNLSHFWVYDFAQVGNDELWIATFGGGIDIVNLKTLAIRDRLRHDATLTSSIGADRVGALTVDDAGLVWVGSWGGGLTRHDPSTRAFRQLQHSPTNPDGPSYTAIVRPMQMSDGTIWLGTNGNGIEVLDHKGHFIKSYRPDSQLPGYLSDGAITCLAQASDGTIWVATLDGGLHRMRADGLEQFERFDQNKGMPGGIIRTMIFDQQGNLWIGSSNGMARIDARNDQVHSYRHDVNDHQSLSGRAVESLAFTADKQLWVGTDNGLNAFNVETEVATRIFHDAKRQDSLPGNWVPDLMVAEEWWQKTDVYGWLPVTVPRY